MSAQGEQKREDEESIERKIEKQEEDENAVKSEDTNDESPVVQNPVDEQKKTEEEERFERAVAERVNQELKNREIEEARKKEDEKKRREEEEKEKIESEKEEAKRLKELQDQAAKEEKEAESELAKAKAIYENAVKAQAEEKKKATVEEAAQLAKIRTRCSISADYIKNIKKLKEDGAEKHAKRETEKEAALTEIEEAEKKIMECKKEIVTAKRNIEMHGLMQARGFSRACALCHNPSPQRRTLMAACGHITCTPCAEGLWIKVPEKSEVKVVFAKLDSDEVIDPPTVACPFCDEKTTCVKMLEEESDSVQVQPVTNGSRKRRLAKS